MDDWKDGTEKRIHKANKVYEHIKKELDLRSKRGYIKAVGYHGLFVDKSRNAAVSCGDRDLKSDVREKKLREKYFVTLSFPLWKLLPLLRKIGDAEAEGEVDLMIYVNQAKYELK